MIYVILGMHKSGTSLISRILHHSGINMGDDIDRQASRGKHYDKYERQLVLSINQDILGSEGIYSLDIEMPDPLQMTENQRIRMRKMIQDCEKQYDDWGFKEPRTCLTYPLWASELPEHKIIALYRSPYELAPRSHAHLLPHRAWKLVKRWCEYNSRVFTYLKDTKMDCIVLNYRKFMMNQSEFKRLCDFVGTNLSDQRKGNFYRHHPRKYLYIRAAEWLLYKKTGKQIKKITEQLESFSEEL